jgi:hypothetical protein
MTKLLTSPSKIITDDDGLKFIEKDEILIFCPFFKPSISASGKCLYNHLIDVPLDIEESGNPRKLEEVTSISCWYLSVEK